MGSNLNPSGGVKSILVRCCFGNRPIGMSLLNMTLKTEIPYHGKYRHSKKKTNSVTITSILWSKFLALHLKRVTFLYEWKFWMGHNQTNIVSTHIGIWPIQLQCLLTTSSLLFRSVVCSVSSHSCGHYYLLTGMWGSKNVYHFCLSLVNFCRLPHEWSSRLISD